MRYFEIRPRQLELPPHSLRHSSQAYFLHELDLRPGLETLFRNCHKDSTQRKIRRSEREGFTYQEGRSGALVEDFYRLFVLTRRRHYAPPPPKVWFQNLVDCLKESLTIRVAYKDGEAAAAILTIRHKDVLVYKYGCSDARFHKLGAMHFLFWQAMQDAKRSGLLKFDLGRSDSANQGLITFKEHWGATRLTVTYSRFCVAPAAAYSPDWERLDRIAKHFVALLPDYLFKKAGEWLYPHLG